MRWRSPLISAFRRPRLLVALCALALAPFVAAAPGHAVRALPTARTAGSPIGNLHVRGNRLLDGAGHAVRLLGVDRSGAEYMCVQGRGIFDGPSDAASVHVMASWHINAVRVPLNEDCWLGINGVSADYSGAAYRQAIAAYVGLLNRNGLAVILDLHWTAPGTQAATAQQPMPDRDHAPAFWASVAARFKGNGAVVFDLFNEPYPDSNGDTTAAWQCWRDGGACPGLSYQAAGMQQLVNRVRRTGAANVIMLGGVQYSNSLSQWLAYAPRDPRHNLAASWHSYNFNLCNLPTCWDATIAPVARKVPVIAGEIGENDCAHGYIDQLLPWLDRHKVSYLAWTWDDWSDCKSGPTLITDYNGTPTGYGVGYKKHLAALARR